MHEGNRPRNAPIARTGPTDLAANAAPAWPDAAAHTSGYARRAEQQAPAAFATCRRQRQVGPHHFAGWSALRCLFLVSGCQAGRRVAELLSWDHVIERLLA